MSTEDTESEVVTLDDNAANVIKSQLQAQGLDPQSAGLRIAVEAGGCAGHTYRFELSADPAAEDIQCITNQVNVHIDRSSKPYLEGANISVKETAHGTGFCIENPNATQECGCGISFQ